MKIKLLDNKELKNFSSGSGIEFFNDRLYLASTDSGDVLIMNKGWKETGRIRLFGSSELRIVNGGTNGIEATTITNGGEESELLLLGSGSVIPSQKSLFLHNLKTSITKEHNLDIFYNRLRSLGIEELNIESAASVEEYIVFCNRAGQSSPTNHMIITGKDFWKDQENAVLSVLHIDLPVEEPVAAGISGFTYSSKNDCLLFTASAEAVSTSGEEDKACHSYLGIIEHAARKIGRKKMKVNSLEDLSVADKKFRGYKMESLCIQSDKEGRMKIQLVADNDSGVTHLFKIRVKL